MELDYDPIGELRILMNREVLDKKKFFQLQNIVKLLPELVKMAKKND